jgi:hypothetical protein
LYLVLSYLLIAYPPEWIMRAIKDEVEIGRRVGYELPNPYYVDDVALNLRPRGIAKVVLRVINPVAAYKIREEEVAKYDKVHRRTSSQ